VSVAYAVGVGLLADGRLAFSLLFPVETGLSFLAVGFALAQLLSYGARGDSSARYEAVLFIACLTSVAVDAADDRFDLVLPLADPVYLTFYAAPICGLLLALASLTVLVSNSQRARRSLASLNELLDSRLRAQAQVLEEAHAREKTLESQRAMLEERQRLTRDVHDGLGGHLVSLLMRLRRGRLNLDDVANEVADSLDDLRLIVSSLDQFDEPIGLALGGFRERMGPKLKAAGLTLVWELEMEASRRQLGPSGTLNLLRIVQEATTNTLRHGHAKTLAIRLRTLDGDLLLEVEDDGIGFSEDVEVSALQTPLGAGRGLSNMRSRAAKIGSTLEISSDHSGTRLTLWIPTNRSSNDAKPSHHESRDDPAT
jgi:signal transduction histidine kinase